MLKRTPIFLRVTEKFGRFDALNEPMDTPEPGETLHAYIMAEHVGNCHINIRGGRGGFYPVVNYRHLSNQPDQATMKSSEAWAGWVDAAARTMAPEIDKLAGPK